MSSNSINDTKMSVKKVKTMDEIKSMSNVSNRTKDFLYSVFNKLDTTDSKGNPIRDNILQKNEGSIYVFEDGSVTITKNDNFYAGTSAEGAEVFAVGDTLNITFSDGSKSVMRNGELVSGITDKGNAYTVKDGILVYDNKSKQNAVPKNTKTDDAKSNTVETNTKNAVKAPKTIDGASNVHDTEKINEKSKINGVNKTVLDNIAKEYQNLIRTNYKINDKTNFYLKYTNIISKALRKEPRTAIAEQAGRKYAPARLETDNYLMELSPIMEPETFRCYWELYDVQEKNK